MIEECAYKVPCGILHLVVIGERLHKCEWVVKGSIPPTLVPNMSPFLQKVVRELDEYFTGVRKYFDIPLDYDDMDSPFQVNTLCELLSVPYGTTISYKTLAERVGHPRGARVVANILHHNPYTLFIPCHRVIGSDGTLKGYNGGLMIKQYLLDLEHTNINIVCPNFFCFNNK